MTCLLPVLLWDLLGWRPGVGAQLEGWYSAHPYPADGHHSCQAEKETKERLRLRENAPCALEKGQGRRKGRTVCYLQTYACTLALASQFSGHALLAKSLPLSEPPFPHLSPHALPANWLNKVKLSLTGKTNHEAPKAKTAYAELPTLNCMGSPCWQSSSQHECVMCKDTSV